MGAGPSQGFRQRCRAVTDEVLQQLPRGGAPPITNPAPPCCSTPISREMAPGSFLCSKAPHKRPPCLADSHAKWPLREQSQTSWLMQK